MVDFEKNAQKAPQNARFDDKEAGFGVLLYIILQFALIYIARFIIFNIGVGYSSAFGVMLNVIIEGLFVLSVLIISRAKKKHFITNLGVKNKINGKIILFCALTCMICLFGLSQVSNVFMDILERLGYKSRASGVSVTTFWELLLNTLTIAIVPAFCEEILFRGLVLNGLAHYGREKAVLISALLFMLMHGSPDQTVHQFILGVVFGYIVYFTGNLWITIIIHFFNNFFVLVINWFYNMSGAASSASTEEVAVSTAGSIFSYLLALALVGVSVYLVIIMITRLAKESNKINLKPSYVSGKEMAFIDRFAGAKEGGLTITNRYGAPDKRSNNSLDGGNERYVSGVEFDAREEKLGFRGQEAEMPDYSSSETLNIGVSEVAQAKKKLSIRAIVYIVAAVCYLGIEWITALIEGFIA